MLFVLIYVYFENVNRGELLLVYEMQQIFKRHLFLLLPFF